MRFPVLLSTALLVLASISLSAQESTFRAATFNASLHRAAEGQLAQDLAGFTNTQARHVAEIIQIIEPDVLLLNEFDYDAEGLALQRFRANYLGVPQGGRSPIFFNATFLAPSNTGLDSGFDLDNDGSATGDAGDSLGFGEFPGQYGMVLLSKHPIVTDQVRTFQTFLWKDMPGALLPDDPPTPQPADWYSEEELAVLRLSSKSHWDVPVEIDGRVVHFLVSHPTPPVFDGAEDRNGLRNHDEIRFWADYIDPQKSAYIYDDRGKRGGLPADARFVIMGDQNADPADGDSVNGAINQLLNSPLVDSAFTPTGDGGNGADTSSFDLRVDYVLPSVAGLTVKGGDIFWPTGQNPIVEKVNTVSDHRLVYLDLQIDLTSTEILEAAFNGVLQNLPRIIDIADGQLRLVYTRGDDALGYSYEVSADHTEWTPLTETEVDEQLLANNPDGTTTILATVPVTASDCFYVRVRVTPM